MTDGQSKDWCFTLNNPTHEEEEDIRELVSMGLASYLIFGRETGANGTHHLQGFLQLTRRLRLGGFRTIRGLERSHGERRRGTPSQAADYCRKDGDFEEFGTISAQGKRSDLTAVRESIDMGHSTVRLWEEHFPQMVRYATAFSKYRAVRNRRDTTSCPEVLVLWGGTGVGKSRYARHVNEDLFSVPDVTLEWWDGYDGQETVLIDDFDGDNCPVARFLRYMDRYEVQVPIKGGFVPLMAKRIWITSNSAPADWFPGVPQVKRDAVRRRITKVIHMHNALDFNNPRDMGSLWEQLGFDDEVVE